MSVVTEQVTEIIFRGLTATEVNGALTEIDNSLTSNLTESDGPTSAVDVVTDGGPPL